MGLMIALLIRKKALSKAHEETRVGSAAQKHFLLVPFTAFHCPHLVWTILSCVPIAKVPCVHVPS